VLTTAVARTGKGYVEIIWLVWREEMIVGHFICGLYNDASLTENVYNQECASM
jgi:hypothetical protein